MALLFVHLFEIVKLLKFDVQKIRGRRLYKEEG